MPGPPQGSPFSDSPSGLSFGRAVQAYSFSRLNGGSLRDAERAAQNACPGCHIPDVAQASAGARQAAAAVFAADAGGGRFFGAARAKATEAGAPKLTATVAYEVTLPGQSGPTWRTVLVDLPPGASRDEAAQAIADAVQAAAEGEEAGYAGALGAVDVRTIIGHY